MKVVGGEIASDHHRYQKANDDGGFPDRRLREGKGVGGVAGSGVG